MTFQHQYSMYYSFSPFFFAEYLYISIYRNRLKLCNQEKLMELNGKERQTVLINGELENEEILFFLFSIVHFSNKIEYLFKRVKDKSFNFMS
jgi:hypothetical protein